MNKLRSILNSIKLFFVVNWNKLISAHNARIMFKEEQTMVSTERLKVCKKCPFNSDNKEKTFRDKFWIFMNRLFNKVYGIDVTLDSICTICGCGTLFLVQEEEKDKCEKNKWVR